ncbi:MAG: diaminopimelate epimerase [Bacteroidetes Order II. Incertae sedis bacterium]|nr:diaminopimelate epimerase [Bacteroidetes Order II. bacterium]
MRRLVLEFTKMHGAGNDFVVIDNRFYHFDEAQLSEMAARLCHRRLGIGADGLLALCLTDEDTEPDLDFRMRYFNADGSLGLMCGNGARVLSRFAHESGIQKPVLQFDTSAGLYQSMVPAEVDLPVRLFVPLFQDYRPDVFVSADAQVAMGPIDYVFTGTQHAVVFVRDVWAFDVAFWGPLLRWHSAFAPEGINMNFVEVIDPGSDTSPGHLHIRTYEKGVEAETLACGTGALAAAIVARTRHLVHSNHIRLSPKGGDLEVGFTYAEGVFSALYQAGPTATVYRGSMYL